MYRYEMGSEELSLEYEKFARLGDFLRNRFCRAQR